MKRQFRFIYILVPLLVVLAYNNCGRVGFDAEKGLSSASFSSQGKTMCDAALMATYSTTWFPQLSKNCNTCHSGAHGSTDISTSYSAFMTKGTSLITYKASNPHGGNNVNLASQIASFSGAWSAAQSDYMNCLASAPAAGAGNPIGAQIALNPKAIPMINATITNQNQWKTVSWDIESEVAQSYMGQFPAIFSIEARYSLYAGAVVGLEFRNPRMRLKLASTPPIQVNAFNLKVNGSLVTDVTTYTGVSVTVASTTNVDLAPGASTALAVLPVNDNTPVSFVFTNLQSTTSTTMPSSTTTLPGTRLVKLSDLLGTDPTLAVFSQSCVSCHSSSRASGGFDITNSNQAISKASSILSRMTNSGAPMPTSGLLGSAKVQVVQDWVNGGAKP